MTAELEELLKIIEGAVEGIFPDENELVNEIVSRGVIMNALFSLLSPTQLNPEYPIHPYSSHHH